MFPRLPSKELQETDSLGPVNCTLHLQTLPAVVVSKSQRPIVRNDNPTLQMDSKDANRTITFPKSKKNKKMEKQTNKNQKTPKHQENARIVQL